MVENVNFLTTEMKIFNFELSNIFPVIETLVGKSQTYIAISHAVLVVLNKHA